MRDAVQNAEDPDAWIGEPADVEAVVWLGQALGYAFPDSYLRILAKHDGFCAGGAPVYSLAESVEVLLVFRERFRALGYWPVGSDGYGNHYVLATKEREAGECLVWFLESGEDYRPVGESYPSYAEFVSHTVTAAI